MWLKQLKITSNRKKKNITLEKILLHFTHQKKKNTNAIYNPIHTHIYIVTLDIYYERIIT